MMTRRKFFAALFAIPAAVKAVVTFSSKPSVQTVPLEFGYLHLSSSAPISQKLLHLQLYRHGMIDQRTLVERLR